MQCSGIMVVTGVARLLLLLLLLEADEQVCSPAAGLRQGAGWRRLEGCGGQGS